jgi:hypothetical protein
VTEITEEVHAMTAFRNPQGRTEARQLLLDQSAEASAEEGIRQGPEDVAKGRRYNAREVLEEMRKKYGIPC